MLQYVNILLSRRRTAVLLLILLGALVYINCLPNELFWDDDDFILNNLYIQDWRWWPKFFTDSILSGTHLVSNYWRPLLQTVFAVEWHLWAGWPPGWHAVSILFHVLAGTILFRTLDLLFRDRTLAFLTALVFIVHPVQTESVVYANSLGDALAAVFTFLGLWFFIKYRQNAAPAAWPSKHYFLALAMYPLALMSKETGILLVAFIALADFFILTPPGPFFQRAWGVLKRVWPFLLTAAGYMALRATALNFSNSFNFYNAATPFTSNVLLRLGTFCSVLASYTGLLFIPYELRVERLIAAPDAVPLAPAVFGGLVLAGLIFLLVRSWNRQPLAAFAVLWFFCAILPTSNLVVIINAIMYEHFLYTALIGIFLLVFRTGLRWADTTQRRRIFWTGTLVLLTFFCIRSAWRTFDWRTAVGFYEQLAPSCPNSYRVLNNFAKAYAEKGVLDKAEAVYQQAVALDPSNAVAYHNLGNLYRDQGKSDLAIEYFQKAISLQKNFVFSYKSLAQLYLNRKDYARARTVLENYFLYTDEKSYTLEALIEIARRQKDADGVARYTAALQELRKNYPGQ